MSTIKPGNSGWVLWVHNPMGTGKRPSVLWFAPTVRQVSGCPADARKLPHSRTGLNVLKARAKVKGLPTMDKRTLTACWGVGLIPAFLLGLGRDRHGAERRVYSVRRRPPRVFRVTLHGRALHRWRSLGVTKAGAGPLAWRELGPGRWRIWRRSRSAWCTGLDFPQPCHQACDDFF